MHVAQKMMRSALRVASQSHVHSHSHFTPITRTIQRLSSRDIAGATGTITAVVRLLGAGRLCPRHSAASCRPSSAQNIPKVE